MGHLDSSWDTLKLEFLIDYSFDLAEILCAFRIQGEEATYKISAKSDNPFLRYGCPTFSSGVPRIVPLTVCRSYFPIAFAILNYHISEQTLRG